MKNTIKLLALKSLAVLAFVSFTLISCNKDDATTSSEIYAELPSDLIGVYSGSLSYTSSDGSVVIGTEDGTATITSTGPKTYKVTFSDNVPQILNFKFITEPSGSFATVGKDGSAAGLVIDPVSMDLGVTSAGNMWTFSGTN